MRERFEDSLLEVAPSGEQRSQIGLLERVRRGTCCLDGYDDAVVRTGQSRDQVTLRVLELFLHLFDLFGSEALLRAPSEQRFAGEEEPSGGAGTIELRGIRKHKTDRVPVAPLAALSLFDERVKRRLLGVPVGVKVRHGE